MKLETSSWKLILGNIQVLLVASHNYPHIRRGKIKQGELGTGDLVEYLCRKTGSWGIISETIQPDPNWYKNSPLREEVKRIIKAYKIKVVLDVHGRRNKWFSLIDFYPNKRFKEKFPASLNELSVIEFVNNEQLTLAEDLDQQGLPCLEIEIRKDGRIPGKQNYEVVISTIEKLVNKIYESWS